MDISYIDHISKATIPDSVSNHQPHQPFIQTQIKENIKAPRHWPLCGEFTGDRWIPRTNGQLRGKCFHLMTSSCKQSRVSPWRACGQRPSWHQCRYGSLWLCLKPRLIFPKQTRPCMFMVVLRKSFWERQITLPTLTGHTVFRAWRRSSCSRIFHDGMCKAN